MGQIVLQAFYCALERNLFKEGLGHLIYHLLPTVDRSIGLPTFVSIVLDYMSEGSSMQLLRVHRVAGQRLVATKRRLPRVVASPSSIGRRA